MTTTVIVLTTGTSWTVPSDWNNSNNTIECYGAGSYGGGAYAKITNLALVINSSYTISIGAGSAGGTAGDTYFSNTTTVLAKGAVGSTGGLASTSVGSIKYSGGNKGSDVSGSGTDSMGGAETWNASGGGGGPANSSSNGINGGNAYTGQDSYTITPGGGGNITVYVTVAAGGSGATGVGPYAGTGSTGGRNNTNGGNVGGSTAPTSATNYGAGGASGNGTKSGTQGAIVISYVPSNSPSIPQFLTFTFV